MGEAMHSESQWRYRAKRHGLRLVRYGQSPGSDQYGPYGLVDRAIGRLVAVRLEPDDVERTLFGEDTEAALPTRQLQLATDGDAW